MLALTTPLQTLREQNIHYTSTQPQQDAAVHGTEGSHRKPLKRHDDIHTLCDDIHGPTLTTQNRPTLTLTTESGQGGMHHRRQRPTGVTSADLARKCRRHESRPEVTTIYHIHGNFVCFALFAAVSALCFHWYFRNVSPKGGGWLEPCISCADCSFVRRRL